jgi:cytochrome P450
MSTTEALRTRAASVITAARPISVVCELLGVPRHDRLVFWRWAEDVRNPKALDALHAYIDVMIADRCCTPTDDLLSQLIQLDVDGEDLTVDEIHKLVIALVADADTD